MSRDGKLREVLDSLSDEPARTLPRQDRELMESVLRRLKIQEARRPRPYEARPVEDRSVSELESSRDEAQRRLQELEALRETHGQEQEELRRIAAERDALLEQQRELEDRLARLEASSHGGPLSYVEDDEVVEFARVDLGPADDMLEFQYLGTDADAGFERPDDDAWEDAPAPDAAPGWDEPSWNGDAAQVDWDDGEDETDAAPWQGGAQEALWPEDALAAEGGAGAEATTAWDEEDPVDPFTGPSESGLDADAENELADLEKQLADLEREIEAREKREKRQD